MKLLFNKNIVTKTFSYKFVFKMFLLLLVFYISGCVNENLTPVAGNVTVNLFDENLFPGSIFGSTVSIGQNPIVFIDGNGIANLKTPSFPYSLTLRLSSQRTYIYDNISLNNIFCEPLKGFYRFQSNSVNLKVQFPIIPTGKEGIIKFISTDPFTDYFGGQIIDSFNNSAYHTINFPINKNSISGKILFLLVTAENYGSMSIEKYGEKNVTLEANTNPLITFTDDDINFNPGRGIVEYDIKSEEYWSDITMLYLSFEGYNISSDIRLYESLHAHYGTLTVPLKLKSDFKLKLYNVYSLRPGYGDANQEKWAFCYPGETIFLDNTTQPLLISPESNEKISDSTTFAFNSQLTSGISFVQFYYGNSENDWSIQIYFTSKNKFTFGELKNYGLIFKPNIEYLWWVKQPYGFSSVDEFVSAPYSSNPNYNGIICSDVGYFRTPP